MTEVEMASVIAPIDTADEASSTPNALKRRRSEAEVEATRDESHEQTKRQRMNGKGSPVPTETTPVVHETSTQEARADPVKEDSHDVSPTTEERSLQPAPPFEPSRRKPSIADEKQRSKRLFGALLGNLARPTTDTKQSSRRAEIEARRKSEIRKQDAETAAQEAQRREKTLAWRRQRQGDVEEENMKVRHRNELERARFLCTETEPRIYWRPWELREGEERKVEEQVRECEERVERERKEFYGRRREKGAERASGEDDDVAGVPRVHDDRENETSDNVEIATKTKAQDTREEELVNGTAHAAKDDQEMHQPAQDGDVPIPNGSDRPSSEAVNETRTETPSAREEEPEPDIEHDGGGEGEEDTVIY